MDTDAYLRQKEWALARGLFLHPALERKQVNGVYGMYAISSIPANTVVASFPVDQLPKSKKPQAGRKSVYGAELENVDMSYIHLLSKELLKRESSSYSGIFDGFEKLDDLRSYSVAFISESELHLLKSFSPTAYTWVSNANQKSQMIVDAITKLDPALPRDAVLTVLLNYQSRSFRDVGIVPVLDQFNHSDRLGNENFVENGRMCVQTSVQHNPGDQVFITYGRKDLLMHAIHYNYFDPHGTHFIQPMRRIFVPVVNPAFQRLAKKYELQTLSNRGQALYFLDDNKALMTEITPTPHLLAYMTDVIRFEQNNPVPTMHLTGPVLQSYMQLLDMLASNNLRHTVQRSNLPSRLHRFHDLLAKEEQMIQANRKWVIEHVA